MDKDVKAELDFLRDEINSIKDSNTRQVRVMRETTRRLNLALKQLRTARNEIRNAKYNISALSSKVSRQ